MGEKEKRPVDFHGPQGQSSLSLMLYDRARRRPHPVARVASVSTSTQSMGSMRSAFMIAK
jgi:hypothetical protein